MIKILIHTVFIIFFFITIPKADISSWVDENGVKHYTNQKPPKDVSDIKKIEELEYNYEEDMKWKREIEEREKAANKPKIKPVPTQITQPSQPSQPSTYKKSAKIKQKRKLSEGLFEVDGYQVNVIGHHRDNKLLVKGRVSGGENCGELSVSIKFDGENITLGTKTSCSVTTKVRDVGYEKSRLIDDEILIGKTNQLIRWTLSDVNVTCVNY